MTRLSRSPHFISIAGLVFVLLAGLLATPFQVAAQVNEKAGLTSHISGDTLAGSSVPFTWSTGTGATEYILWVGTTAGHNQLYSKSQGLNTSVTVNNLPVNGSQVFVRLMTRFAPAPAPAQFTDYIFTAGTITKAALTSPAPNSTLTGPTATFTWSNVTGATEYLLWVGTTAGHNQLYSKSQGLNQSVTVNNLPHNGSQVFVRLFTRVATGLLFTDYTFTAGTITKAALTNPTPGSNLPEPTATFNWSNVSEATEYILWVGTTAGHNQLYSKSQGLNTSVTVKNLPNNGGPIFVRLFTRVATGLLFTDYSFTSGVTPAALTSPTPGTTFTGTAATFNWSAGVGATEYFLRVGTTLGGTDLYSASQGLSLAGTVSTLPGTGVPVYVRLLTRFGSSEQFTDYTFTATTFSKAELISPTPGSDFAGLAATFTWTAAPNATGYELWVGTTPGDHDVAQQSLAPGGLFAFVNNLPGGSAHLFVRLITKLAGGDQYIDYTFTGAPFCF